MNRKGYQSFGGNSPSWVIDLACKSSKWHPLGPACDNDADSRTRLRDRISFRARPRQLCWASPGANARAIAEAHRAQNRRTPIKGFCAIGSTWANVLDREPAARGRSVALNKVSRKRSEVGRKSSPRSERNGRLRYFPAITLMTPPCSVWHNPSYRLRLVQGATRRSNMPSNYIE